ncbi:MAG: Fe2+-dependent dioxygenase [Hydrogenophaga sp.]|uniref:Fe2+-dependent dioxygenase n=1 Tax=Hydrogenophaga sp. TaxID=1904254 RepID=UPI001DB00F49|nr:Fe2+-dependent dioxygenase [Hydrogenophaga sp.]MBX3609848.1 Fe2+-dependent dioxygenase [Hydrogenophaga sp.]
MLLRLTSLLSPDELTQARALLDNDAPWIDGGASAGAQAQQRKHNQQIASDSEHSRRLQSLVLAALQREPMFLSAALPKRIFPPRFNRYRASGEHYGAHIDNAILKAAEPGQWLRADLSCTVFLADAGSYDGGELVIHDRLGVQRIKLDAGDALLYPAGLLHEVLPVTRGERLASFLWVESLVPQEAHRQILFDLDMNLVALRARHGESDETVGLTGVYHNLLRQWATP